MALSFQIWKPSNDCAERMLTDTTFWIDLERERRRGRRGPAHTFIARHRAQSLLVSIITFGELAVGFRTPHELDSLLRRIRVLMLHRHVAWEASRIRREIAALPINQNDVWIAATARAWGQRLISNDRDFDVVPRLRRTGYPSD
jgi:predicted nucleic acid-binding protein